MKDQKDFEQSIKDITKTHDQNTHQMGADLDKMEHQVSQLKFTKDNLNSYYESQLDQAHKEMVNFYNNLDNCDEKELSNSAIAMHLDKAFFIKPTQVISLHLQQSQSNANSALYSQHINDQINGSSDYPNDKPAQKSTGTDTGQIRLKITKKDIKTERQMANHGTF